MTQNSQYIILKYVLEQVLSESGLIKIIYEFNKIPKLLWATSQEIDCAHKRILSFSPELNICCDEDGLVVYGSSLGVSGSSTMFFPDRDPPEGSLYRIPSLLRYDYSEEKMDELPKNHLKVVNPLEYEKSPHWDYKHRPMYNVQCDTIYGIATPSGNTSQGCHVLEWDEAFSTWRTIGQASGKKKLKVNKSTTFNNQAGDPMIFALGRKSNEIITFNCKTKKWLKTKTHIECDKNNIHRLCIVGMGCNVYIIGGGVIEGRRMLKWSSVDGKLHKCRNMINARFASSAIAIDARIYVLGGSDDSFYGSKDYQSMEVYDTTTNEWSCVRVPRLGKYPLLAYG